MTVAGLRDLLEPGVRALGFELVDIEYARFGGQNVLRVYIDHPDGITVDHCATVSRQVSAALDVEDPIPEAYVLEVSSPGFDRLLRKPAHFERFRGARVRVELTAARDGRRRYTGDLVAVSARGIELEVDGETVTVDFAAIDRARLAPP